MRKSGNEITLKETLDVVTGEQIPNAGLEKAELFLTTRKDTMQRFYERNHLCDARGTERGEATRTCHFAWMRWHQYVKKNKDKTWSYSGMPPCITARIDRFLLSRGAFEVSKMEVFNDLADEDRRNEHAQAEASNLSDHYAMAIEVRPRAALKQGVTKIFTNTMFDIERSPEEEERYAQCEVQEETEEPSPKQQEKEVDKATIMTLCC